ncbi:hypothetical protein [Bowmanella pacifica]|nr:hypothetical protein [Bowmanella pacifica]
MYRRVYLVGFRPHLQGEIRETALNLALPLHFFHALQDNAESGQMQIDNILGERLRQSINSFLLSSADWVVFALGSEADTRQLASDVTLAMAQGKDIVFLHDAKLGAPPACLEQIACYVADDYLQLLKYLEQHSAKVTS